MLIMYTDGGNSSKNKVGGCSAIITRDGEVVAKLSEAYDNNPTNNQMELGGVLLGLTHIIENPELGKQVNVISDSEYIVLGARDRLDNWIAKGWKNTAGKVKNRPLWEAIRDLKKELDITWEWVKGHDGDRFNEMADKLCVKAYKDLLTKKQDGVS